MKRALMLVLIIAMLAQTATAVNIALNIPARGETATTGEVAFSCTAMELGGVTSLTLKLDPGTGFEDKYTADYIAIPGDPMPMIMLDYIVPTAEALEDGTYTWKCVTSDGTGDDATQTFTVAIPVISFTGTIPAQTLTAGEPKSNAFDLDDYFTNAEAFTISGNSTVQVIIDTQHKVSLYAETAATETITFTSAEATSNGILVTATEATTTNLTTNETGPTTNLTDLLTGISAPIIKSYQPTEDIDLPPGGMQVFTITKSGNGTTSWYLDGDVIEGGTGDSYTYQDATAGTHTVKAVVSDGAEEANHIWTITVTGETEAEETEVEEIGEESVCGDDSCDADEDCSNCEDDCGCASGEACEAGMCIEKAGNSTLTWAVLIGMLVVSGAVAMLFFIKKKPKTEAKEETPTEEIKPTDVSDFYTKAKPIEKPEYTKTLFPKNSPGAKYAQAMRLKGASDADIKRNLKSRGWTDQQIEEAFK